MSYFDGIFVVSDVYQLRLAEVWPTYGYLDPTVIDPLYYLTKFVVTGTNISYPFNSDSSTNKLNLTPLGDTKAANFNPYTPGYYSNYFDGSGDYLTVPDNNPILRLSNNSFTIEAWIYLTTTNAGTLIGQWTIGGGYAFLAYVTGGGNMTFYWNNAGSYSTTSSPFAMNRWIHVAIVKNGTGSNNGAIYVDGVLKDALFTIPSINGSTAVVSIGYNTDGANYFTGYISNFRLVNGTAVYTSNFTPPTAPLTSITNTSLLMCQSNRLIDNSTNNFTITKNGDVTVVAANPFSVPSTYSNYGSAYFDGTGDYLTTPSNTALSLGTGDFTIEAWVYTTLANQTYGSGIIGTYDGASNGGWSLIVNRSSGGPYGIAFIHANAIQQSYATYLSVNTWHHIAVVRSGTTLKTYLNGTEVATGTYATADAVSAICYIGSQGAGQYHAGYISDIRVVKGTAVYTGNFTPPISSVLPTGASLPYTSASNVNTTFATTNVSLLALQNNQPHNNTTFLDKSNFRQLITRTGNANQGTVNPYTNSWATFMPATGSYITGSNSIFNISATTSVWTYEGWIYPIGIGGGWFFAIGNGGAWGNSLNIGYSNGGDRKFEVGQSNGSSTPVSFKSTNLYNPNKWYHIAVTRTSAGVITLFVNGVADGTQTYNAGTVATGTTFVINGLYDNNGLGGSGGSFLISNVRFVVGNALYATGFIPSSSPLLPIANTAVLTCQSNRIVDNGPINIALTRAGSTAISFDSPISKAYLNPTPKSYSMYFDGSGDYLNAPSNPTFAFGTGDFTIEGWFYFTGTIGTYQRPWWFGDDNDNLEINTSVLRVGGASQGTLITGGTTILANRWYHIALTRASGSYKLWLNGSQEGSTATNSYNSSARTFTAMATSGGSNPSAGFISDLRIVKGTSLYNSTFSVPTNPLTAVANTVLLTCQSSQIVDNSPNTLPLVAVGDTRPAKQNPFGFNDPVTTDYSPSTHGGSVYFDGNGDYLTLPTSTLYNLTGDFTIESWIYPMKAPGGDWVVMDARSAGGSAVPWIFGLTQSTGAKTYFYVGSALTGTAVISTNVWTHIAWERNGSNLTSYVNGARDYYNASYGTGAISPGSVAPRINSKDLGLGASYESYGYISDFRFTNGTAVYKNAFVPPETPLSVYGNTTVLLNFTDAAAKDYTMGNNMETTGNLRISSANSKFGGTSLYFDGTTATYGNVSMVSNTLILGTDDFTAEMWINPYSNTTTTYPMTIGQETTGRLNIILVNGTLVVNLYGATSANLTLTGPLIPANLWSHIAVVRANANIRGYYNGNVLPNIYATSAAIGNGPLRLGSDATGGSPFVGYMDDVRITANARYTANFTPAIAVLPTR